jgi:hypothetical protein
MFIARSVRRVRFARLVFVLAGVLPCVCLAAWAVHLRSAGHRESLRARWQQAVGLPLEVAAVEHLRPGVVRVHGGVLRAENGGSPLPLPVLEVEDAAGELRLRVAHLDLGADAAGLLAGLAAEWLDRESRFPRDCVIDVGELHWDVTGWSGIGRGSAAGRLRIECVAREGTRAIRCSLAAADGNGRPCEMRVVRLPVAADRGGDVRYEINADCGTPLPLAVVARLFPGAPVPAIGSAAAVSGTLEARADGGRSSGRLAARVERADLTGCAALVGGRAAGEAEIVVRRLDWDAGRLSFAEAEVLAGPGQVGRGLLDAVCRAFGLRPGERLFALPAGADPQFDAAGMLLRIDGRGLEILSPTRLQGAVAVVGGRPLVEPPTMIVPLGRLADWLAGPAVAGPPTGRPGRIEDLLPRGSEAVRPGPRGGF